MGKPSFLFLIMGVTVASWFALQRFEIRGLQDLELVRRGERAEGDAGIPPAISSATIRVASFNMQSYGSEKASRPAVLEVLARVIREFDVVAVQEVSSPRPDVLRSLLDRINETGRHFTVLAGPPVGHGSDQQRYAFFFDQQRIETARESAYTIDDPDGLLYRPPFVGWFRVRGPSPDKAFTFTLVNVHTNPDDVAYETQALDDVLYAVRDDDRGEDDVILLGDFHADEHHLGELATVPTFFAAISETATNTENTAQYDNLVFQLSATTEYAGRSGVFDFMREFNLTLAQALQVSNHLPVWAEFSIHEGGHIASVVATAKVPVRR